MRVGMMLNYAGGFTETVSELGDFERAGLEIVFVPEAYSFDAVSQLGFIAARTTTMEIASGILPIYSRTPALTAMTAAGLDFVSGGRFTLGLGTSGPQVIEGWHGVPYDAPVGRTRELIEICRMVWRRERLDYHGRHYTLPLPADQGTGLGKPLKLINHPVRERIPIVIAALGPKNVALAAELAEGWQPIFYFPEKAGLTWDEPLAEGRAKRDTQPAAARRHRRRAARHRRRRHAPARPHPPVLRALHRRHGRARQELLLRPGLPFRLRGRGEADPGRLPVRPQGRGRRPGPGRAGREDLAHRPAGLRQERLAAYREAGVTTLNVTALAPTHDRRVKDIEAVRALAG